MIEKMKGNKYIEQNSYGSTYLRRYFNIELFYCDLDELLGDRDGKWEHQGLHKTSESVEEYYNSIDPVVIKRIHENGKKFTFWDGFHRVNFCKKHSLPVPCVVLTPKPDTHVHSYVSSHSCDRRVFDHECKDDCKNPQERCNWMQCRSTGRKWRNGKELLNT